jgi:putative nucleotidyltransferase with HDIG domain
MCRSKATITPKATFFNHTMQVTDLAAGVKHRSADARAFMWAALLHDLGKLTTTKLRRGRITSYDHDVAGEKLAREFLQKCACDEALVTHVCALVRWHMQVMFISKNMPFADMPSMLASVDPGEVALLAYCDRLGRGKLSEKRIAQEKKDIETFLEKCAAVRPGITQIMTDQETTG